MWIHEGRFGRWHGPSYWMNVTPGGTAEYPDEDDYVVFPGGVNVLLSGGGFVAGVRVLPGATVTTVSGSIHVFEGTIQNDGVFRLGDSSSFHPETDALTLSGAGEFFLASRLTNEDGMTLVNSPGHTIRARRPSGTINTDVINQGFIKFDPAIRLDHVDLDNSLGVIIVNAELDELISRGQTTIHGGGLHFSNQSSLSIRQTGLTPPKLILQDLAMSGTGALLAPVAVSLSSSSSPPVTFEGVFGNSGLISFVPHPDRTNGEFLINNTVTFTGDGEIKIAGVETFSSHDEFYSPDGATDLIVNDTQHTISGEGYIGVDVTNKGILHPEGVLEFGGLTLMGASNVVLGFPHPLGSTYNENRIDVDGSLFLDGMLTLDVPDSIAPGEYTYQVMRGDSVLGAFESIDVLHGHVVAEDVSYELRSTRGGVMVEVQLTVTPSGLPGDYNNDGLVNAIDYSVWRRHLGQSESLPNDLTPGAVTREDYLVWRNFFGVAPSPQEALAAAPEPVSLWLVFAAVASAGLLRWVNLV